MRGKSFQIALAAVSCALATIFLCLGLNVPFLMITGYVFASLALMLPLAKDFRVGGFLAYLATCLISLAFGAIARFYIFFPFLVFFGLHPLVNSLQKKYKINRWLALGVKAVWFDAMLCCTVLLLFAMSADFTLPYEWMYDWIYVLTIAAGTIVFIVYDWAMFKFQGAIDYYVGKIERGRRSSSPNPPQKNRTEEDIDDVFDIGNEIKPPEQRGGEEHGEEKNEKEEKKDQK